MTRPIADHSFMEEPRRELALFASEMMGAQTHAGQFRRRSVISGLFGRKRRLRDLIENCPHAFMGIDSRPGLHILDINDAYSEATLTARRTASGEKLFTVFPDNPDTPGADGVSNLYQSLRKVVESGNAHTMGVQRYDVRNDHGCFVRRRWQCRNSPIFDESGRLLYLLHHAVDVSAPE